MRVRRGGQLKDSTFASLLYTLRPWQWYKQSMLLLGIIFSGSLFAPAAWSNLVPAILSFCAVAGATYIYNDISDREADRQHPEKRHRPIASGQVSVPIAATFGIVLFAGGIGIAYLVNRLYLLVVLVYLVQNALYSLYLKEIVIVDVLVIAIGFVLRAIGGVVAIDVYLSPWLVICTFLAALMLAIGKRRHELKASDNPAETRTTLGEYTTESLDQLLMVVLATLLVAYSLYTFFRTTQVMMLTLPFAFFAAFRYHHLVHTTNVSGDPVRLFMDPQFLVNLALWGTLTAIILYAGHELLALFTSLA